MSQAGIISANTVNNANGGSPVIYKTSSLINFKNTGNTTIFTTIGTFIPITYSIKMSTLTGFSGDITFNLGWTGPDFTDLVNSANTGITAAGQVIVPLSPIPFGSPYLYVPASTTIVFRITSGELATTASGVVSVIGFYS